MKPPTSISGWSKLLGQPHSEDKRPTHMNEENGAWKMCLFLLLFQFMFLSKWWLLNGWKMEIGSNIVLTSSVQWGRISAVVSKMACKKVLGEKFVHNTDTTSWRAVWCTGFLSEIGTKLRDLAVGQAGGSCYSRAALSSNDSKTL